MSLSAGIDAGRRGRYRFRLSEHDATFRMQIANVFDKRSWGLNGAGVYAANAGRALTGYLTMDL